MTALDRRTFLRALGLAPLVALEGCATELLRTTGRSQIEYGPAAFEVTSRSALVWHRLQRRGRVHDRVRDRRPTRHRPHAGRRVSDATAISP